MIPKGVSKDFLEAWQGFDESCDAKSVIKHEGFRLLVLQVGGSTKLMHKVEDFVNLKPHFNKFIKQIYLNQLLHHLVPADHKYSLVYDADTLHNIVQNFEIHGQVTLKPQRYGIHAALARFETFRILKKESFPFEGRTVRALKDNYFVFLKGDKMFELRLARTKKDFVLRYKIFVNDPCPMYKNFEKKVLSMWKMQTLGELK